MSGTKRRRIAADAQPPSAEQEAILWTVNMEECRVKLRWEMRFTFFEDSLFYSLFLWQRKGSNLQCAAKHWLCMRHL